MTTKMEKTESDKIKSEFKERVRKSGLKDLTNAEVLELVLQQFFRADKAKKLSYTLLEKYHTLNAVFDAPLDALLEYDGMTEEAAFWLSSSKEFRAYIYRSEFIRTSKIKDMRSVKDFLIEILGFLPKEHLVLICLDKKYKILSCCEAGKGGVVQTQFHLRGLADIALAAKANYIIIAHNHPSGCCEPSVTDLENTKYLFCLFDNLGIEILDHILIAGQNSYSFRENLLGMAAFSFCLNDKEEKSVSGFKDKFLSLLEFI